MRSHALRDALRWRLPRLALLLTLAGAALTAGAAGTSSLAPMPAVPAGKCVEDTPFMRRNHMELLKHQRDLTVHEGIRTARYSLAHCVACHASKETGRVTGSKDAFCEGCHRYASVKLDCFECHTDKAKAALATAAGNRSHE